MAKTKKRGYRTVVIKVPSEFAARVKEIMGRRTLMLSVYAAYKRGLRETYKDLTGRPIVSNA